MPASAARWAASTSSASGGGNILQFDAYTGEFVCIFSDVPEIVYPYEIVWMHDGHLWVSCAPPFDAPFVVELDGQTGAFRRSIVDTNENLPYVSTMSFGGPTGSCITATQAISGNETVYELDPIQGGVLGPVLFPEPPMLNPQFGRFAANGNYLLIGSTAMTPLPTLREFDGQTLAFVRDIAVDLGAKYGVVETLGGCCYLVSELRLDGGHRIDQYDIATGDFVGTAIPRAPAQGNPAAPGFFQAMNSPADLAIGPNGHLFVVGFATPVQTPNGDSPRGAVHEFDLATQKQVRLIGQDDAFDYLDPERLNRPAGLEFKPLPGDYGSSGGAFQGN